MGKKLTPDQIPPDAPVIPITASSFRDIREGQIFGLVCIRCGKLQHVKEYDPRKIESNKQMLCNDCSKFRFTYDGISFDSSWELAIWIYAKDHNIHIEREPVKLSFKRPRIYL